MSSHMGPNDEVQHVKNAENDSGKDQRSKERVLLPPMYAYMQTYSHTHKTHTHTHTSQ